MFISLIDSNTLLIGCNDQAILEEAQGIMDGDKVRGKMQFTAPIKSGPKLFRYRDMVPGLEWQSQEVENKVIAVALNATTRIDNINKIKAQYGKEITFNYDYKGVYTPLEHQKIMFNAMAYNDAAAMLADPGTCKTGPYLWMIDHKIRKGQAKRALIITLSQLKRTVYEEMKIQVPHIKGVILKTKMQSSMVFGKKYKDPKKNIDYDVYISNYESAYSLIDFFEDDYFDIVVLDEAHRIGAPTSRQTKSIIGKFEAAKYKYIITGTLNANNLMSFYLPFRFLGPDTVPFANYYEFRRRYMFPVDPEQHIWVPSQTAKLEVRKMIGNISVSFKKEDCLNLPPLIYEKAYCEFGDEQARIYTDMATGLIANIDNMCKKCSAGADCDRRCENSIEAKNALVLTTKLRQIACGFYINTITTVDDNGKQMDESKIITFNENPKLSLLMQMLTTIPEGKKVIIWSGYIYAVKLIHETISKAYGQDCVLTCYDKQDAYTQVEKFKDPKISYMVANPTKMGVGQNIQFSNYQFFFNNSYSYVQREQAIGRQHREGQKESVTVFDFMVRGSIDEDVLDALMNKRDLDTCLIGLARVVKNSLKKKKGGCE